LWPRARPACISVAALPIACAARRALSLPPRISSDLANHIVQVTSEAKARPIITALTMMSAARNIPQGDRSCGNVSAIAVDGPPPAAAGCGSAGAAVAGAFAVGEAGACTAGACVTGACMAGADAAACSCAATAPVDRMNDAANATRRPCLDTPRPRFVIARSRWTGR